MCWVGSLPPVVAAAMGCVAFCLHLPSPSRQRSQMTGIGTMTGRTAQRAGLCLRSSGNAWIRRHRAACSLRWWSERWYQGDDWSHRLICCAQPSSISAFDPAAGMVVARCSGPGPWSAIPDWLQCNVSVPTCEGCKDYPSRLASMLCQ